MNKIGLLRDKEKKYRELYFKLKAEMEEAKTKWYFAKDQLERSEASLTCDYCKAPIKEGAPYITSGLFYYCSKDCKCGGDLKEIESLQALENSRQNGNKSF